MGNAISYRNCPPPACRARIRTLQGESWLTSHRHQLTLCGKRSGEHAASPAAWGMPSHAVPARLRPAGYAYAHSRGKPGSLPTDTGLPFAISDPASTPPVTQHGSTFLACACPQPATHQAEPPPYCRSCRPIPRTAKKQDTPEGVSCFSMGSEGVMPWQNGSDRNISRYSGGTARCNVPPDRHAAA